MGREGCLNGRGGGTRLCSDWVSALREGVSVSVSKRKKSTPPSCMETSVWNQDYDPSTPSCEGSWPSSPHGPTPRAASTLLQVLQLVLGGSGQEARKGSGCKGKGFFTGPHGSTSRGLKHRREMKALLHSGMPAGRRGNGGRNHQWMLKLVAENLRRKMAFVLSWGASSPNNILIPKRRVVPCVGSLADSTSAE